LIRIFLRNKMSDDKPKRYKTILGVARLDEEQYPGMKGFDTALDEAVKEFYVPIFSTFRVTRVEGNILFAVIAELVDTPDFVGERAGFQQRG
jgi:hypothetical protein